MKLWIRVDASLPRDPAVAGLAEDIGATLAATIGHIVCVWAAMSEHAEDGDLSAVNAVTLERWALWRGRKGRFAAAFRARFVGPDGVVHGWLARQGKLLQRMERDRARHRTAPGTAPTPSSEPPRKFRGNSTEESARLHGNSTSTERNGTNSNSHYVPAADDAAGSVDAASETTAAPPAALPVPRRSRAGRASWLTPYLEAWTARYGTALTVGKAADHLAPVRRLLGDEEAVARWARYLDATPLPMASPSRFAETHAAYGDEATAAPVRLPAPGAVATTGGEAATRRAELQAAEALFAQLQRHGLTSEDRARFRTNVAALGAERGQTYDEALALVRHVEAWTLSRVGEHRFGVAELARRLATAESAGAAA